METEKSAITHLVDRNSDGYSPLLEIDIAISQYLARLVVDRIDSSQHNAGRYAAGRHGVTYRRLAIIFKPSRAISVSLTYAGLWDTFPIP